MPDQTIRPDGLALEVRAWGPASDRNKPADFTFLLTEYIGSERRSDLFACRQSEVGRERRIVYSVTDNSAGKELYRSKAQKPHRRSVISRCYQAGYDSGSGKMKTFGIFEVKYSRQATFV